MFTIRYPSEKDPYGLIFLAMSATPSFDNYYESIKVLTSYFRNDSWINSCSGYYINSVDYGLPRVTYFAADNTKAKIEVEKICTETGLIQVKEATDLKPVKFKDSYGGPEDRFRRYLCTYTQFGLELLESACTHAQRLFATYRWRIWIAGESGRSHMEESFLRYCPSYQSLPPMARDEFWADFDFAWGWNHMFVNMIIAIDWNLPRGQTSMPPSDGDLTAVLAKHGLGFDIPQGWKR